MYYGLGILGKRLIRVRRLMNPFAYHSGERVGVVIIYGMGKGSDMDRAGKNWGGTGEWFSGKHGGWGPQDDFGIQIPKSNSGAGYGVVS